MNRLRMTTPCQERRRVVERVKTVGKIIDGKIIKTGKKNFIGTKMWGKKMQRENRCFCRVSSSVVQSLRFEKSERAEIKTKN